MLRMGIAACLIGALTTRWLSDTNVVLFNASSLGITMATLLETAKLSRYNIPAALKHSMLAAGYSMRLFTVGILSTWIVPVVLPVSVRE